MNTQDINLELLSELQIPQYHDYFVASQLNKGFSFQMRALRKSQDLTQIGLAELAETKQSVISRIETNGVSNLSIKTLLKLASAFNVGLVLRFVSIEHLLDWKKPISLEELSPNKSKKVLKQLEEPKVVESGEEITEILTRTRTGKLSKKRKASETSIPEQPELKGLGFAPVINKTEVNITAAITEASTNSLDNNYKHRYQTPHNQKMAA